MVLDGSGLSRCFRPPEGLAASVFVVVSAVMRMSGPALIGFRPNALSN